MNKPWNLTFDYSRAKFTYQSEKGRKCVLLNC